MSYYVYMLKSQGYKPVTYVGYTKNIRERIILHNSGKGAKFTRGRKWKIIYKKGYNTKTEAMQNEYLLKKNKSKRKNIKENFLLKYMKIK